MKGGLLISSMIGITERTTMDMDTTVRGIPMEEGAIRDIIKKIISIDVNDGIVFDFIKMELIRGLFCSKPGKKKYEKIFSDLR